MRERINEIFKELKEELGIMDDVKLEFKNYKKWIASASLNKKTIRLNKNLLNEDFIKNLGHQNHEDFIIKVLRHELMHIKLNTKYHIAKYFEDLI